MKQYLPSEFLPLIVPHGRTIVDEERPAFIFNWTLSGFDVKFTGKVLRAKLFVVGNKPILPPSMPWDGKSYEYGVLGIFQGDELLRRFECDTDEGWYTLWEADEPGTYAFTVRKTSENFRGRAGLLLLETDGELLPAEAEKKDLTIEFVGDSITCGYGNESKEAFGPFLTMEENGWITYAALAARKLNADMQCICVSGISVSNSLSGPMFGAGFPTMEETYPYTDLPYDQLIEREPRKWDFAANQKDIVVINLGTNDANPINFGRDYAKVLKEEEHFVERYAAFIRQVRALNGPKPFICFTLGSMDYYLFDQIRHCVEEYVAETGDERVCCFKYRKMQTMFEGSGGAGHPSAKSHERMAMELVENLKLRVLPKL